MLDRRSVLKNGAAAAALAIGTPALAKAAAAAPAANPEAAKMNAMFDAFMSHVFDQAPEFTTNLGIDKGDRAYQKFMVGDRSLFADRTLQAHEHRPACAAEDDPRDN